MSETRPRPAWMLAYETAYYRANGKTARVVARGGGWYRIDTARRTGYRCHRRAEIEELTRSLEERCHA